MIENCLRLSDIDRAIYFNKKIILNIYNEKYIENLKFPNLKGRDLFFRKRTSDISSRIYQNSSSIVMVATFKDFNFFWIVESLIGNIYYSEPHITRKETLEDSYEKKIISLKRGHYFDFDLFEKKKKNILKPQEIKAVQNSLLLTASHRNLKS